MRDNILPATQYFFFNRQLIRIKTLVNQHLKTYIKTLTDGLAYQSQSEQECGFQI